MWALNALLKKTHLTPDKDSDADKHDTSSNNTTATATATATTTESESESQSQSATTPATDNSADDAVLAARLAAAREAWQRQQFDRASSSSGAGAGATSTSTSTCPNLPGELVARATVTFSLLSPEGQIHVKDNQAELLLHRVADYDYSLSVCSHVGGVLLSCPVSDSGRVSVSFWGSSHSVVWSLCVEHGSMSMVQAFHAQYHDLEQEQHTNHTIQQAILQHAHQNTMQHIVQARDSEWLFSAFDDSESKSEPAASQGSDKSKRERERDWDWEAPRQVINTRQTLAHKLPKRTDADSESESECESDESDSELERKHGSGSGSRQSRSSRRITSSHDSPGSMRTGKGGNSQLAVGSLLPRTFVGRGSTLGVFAHDSDGVLTYLNRIPTVSSLDGTALRPSQLLLQQQDHHMAMLHADPSATAPTNKVYDLDIQRGQVVQEYGVSEDFMIRSIAAPRKYAGLDTDTTVAAVNNNTLFSLDPRINIQNKMAHKFQYASSTGLTCLATSEDGHIAVGSEKGEIRLFSQIGQKAKTLLPGLGDPILSLDVSGDGGWILATCRHYLLVIPTTLESGKTGFTQPMGNQHKPAPIKLTLSPQDLLRYNIIDVSFSSARFNTGPDSSCERWIVSSTGRYIVTWNFDSVRAHIKSDYTIKQAQQQVVADQFIYGRDDTLVVTEQDQVYTQHRTRTGTPHGHGQQRPRRGNNT